MGENDLEYEGNAMQMAMCFKNLKNAIRNPLVVHSGTDHKPHYLKMTFSTCRQAVNGDKYLELSKLLGTSNSSLKQQDSTASFLGGGGGSRLQALQSSSKIPALMRAGKEMYNEDSLYMNSLGGGGGSQILKKKSKKEEMIDKKIEYLLDTYKRQDEELLKKAGEKNNQKKKDRKKLRDKFGFSDDDEDEDENNDRADEDNSHKGQK